MPSKRRLILAHLRISAPALDPTKGVSLALVASERGA